MTVTIPDGVAALLHAGKTNKAIAAESGVAATTVARWRAALGIAPHPSGRQSAPSLQAAFEAWTRPTDGGHVEWTGSYTAKGTPMLVHRNRTYSAYRTAFFIRTGVWPTGQAKPECGRPGCVAQAHVDDTATRDRTRATYAALTGYRENSDNCRRGHPYAEHGRWRSNGKRYCHTCQQQRVQQHAAARQATAA